MNKVLAMFALVVGLSACHVGFGIGDNRQPSNFGLGDNRQPSNYVATDTLESAVAQASMGNRPGERLTDVDFF